MIFYIVAFSMASKNTIFGTDLFFTVPNIPITNRESGIMTRALPTPTEKAKSSHFDRTRGYRNQKFPTIVYTYLQMEPNMYIYSRCDDI